MVNFMNAIPYNKVSCEDKRADEEKSHLGNKIYDIRYATK